MIAVNTPYNEAVRYIENARDTLKRAGKMDGEYKDVKYVQTASGTAYLGVLITLDEYLKRKEGNRYSQPQSIEDYQRRIAKQNKKVNKWLKIVYADLHLVGYYHGTTSYEVIRRGLENAEKIINLIKTN